MGVVQVFVHPGPVRQELELISRPESITCRMTPLIM